MLFGRDREQSLLDETLASARSGRGEVLAVIGEVGIGKSALLEYAYQRAVGMNVLRARGVQSEAQIPFAGLFELLRPAFASLARIPPLQVAALEGALALRPASGEDRFAIGAATLSLLAAYAEQSPLLVIVDDAQWLDGSSANALRFAARRLAADPIALLLGVRAGEPSLLDGADLPLLRLEGLDRAAATELLRQRGPGLADRQAANRLAGRLHRETGGNPLAILELADERTWLEETPLQASVPVVVSVANSYALRFDSLPSPTRQMLVLLAASDSGDLSLLVRPAAALRLDVDELAPAEVAGLVDVRGPRAEWRHPLARSAVYGRAEPAERRAAHRALADALPDADDDRRAWHLALAALGPDTAASSALEQAGIRSRDRSAYDVASRTFQRAASLASEPRRRGPLLYAAADAAWLAGLGDRAVALLDEAGQESPEPLLAIAIEHLRGHISTRRGHVSEGHRLLCAAANDAASVDPPGAVVMLAEAVNACFYAGDAVAMRRTADQIAAIAGTCTDTRSEFFASMAEGMALVFSGEGDRGPRLIRHGVELLVRSDELRDDPRLLAWAAMGPLWLREATGGTALVDRALAVARSRSAAGVLPFILSHVAADRAASDRWPEAEAAFYEAIAIARESGQGLELATSLARLSLLEARQGKVEPCAEHAAEALGLSARFGLGPTEVWALNALGDLELGCGRPEEAIVRYEEQLAALRARGINDIDLSPAPELVEAYLRTGRTDQAAETAEAFAREATLKRLPWAMARAARSRGLVATEDQFEAYFAEAISHHAETPDAFELARTHLAFGSRLRRHRQRVKARAELRIAIEIFDHLGAEPWSQFSRAELAATGETVRRRDPGTLTQLTPQELQIAVLLAEGRTTREAGAALFLSPKTIEYHLRSVYRKLGIASRDELSSAMERRS
ncbi:MAG: ATP-binding protein [Acidimicrobiales bacterium]